MVVISLRAFDHSVTPATATVSNPPADAVAEFQISLEKFRALFQVQGVSNISDNEDSSNSIRYFVDAAAIVDASTTSGLKAVATDAWPFKRFNAGFAKVTANAATSVSGTGTALDATDLGVVRDYMRDLSFKMLGSPHLSNLFTNDFTVQSDVVTKLKATMVGISTQIMSLHKNAVKAGTRYSFTAADTTVYPMLAADEDDDYYTTNNHTANTNICRELFINLFKQAPERFSDITFDKYTLPFEAGDRLTFKVTLINTQQYGVALAASASDTPTVGWAASGKIPDRVYTIVLILTPTADISNPYAENLNTLFTPTLTGIPALT